MKKITETKNLNNQKDQSCKSIKESGLRAGKTAINKQGDIMEIIKGVRDKAMAEYEYNSIRFASNVKASVKDVEISKELIDDVDKLICDYLMKHEAIVKGSESEAWHELRLAMIGSNFNLEKELEVLLVKLEKINFIERNLKAFKLDMSNMDEAEVIANYLTLIKNMEIGLGSTGWSGGFKSDYFLVSSNGEQLKLRSDITEKEIRCYIYNVVMDNVKA